MTTKQKHTDQTLPDDTIERIRQISLDAGKMVIEIADVAGAVEIIDQQSEQQTREFGNLNQTAREMETKTTDINEAIQAGIEVAEEAVTDLQTSRRQADRAGDAGRRFAVVANKVKALAGQTAEATKQIDETLDTLSGEIEKLQRKSDQGAKKFHSQPERHPGNRCSY